MWESRTLPGLFPKSPQCAGSFFCRSRWALESRPETIQAGNNVARCKGGSFLLAAGADAIPFVVARVWAFSAMRVRLSRRAVVALAVGASALGMAALAGGPAVRAAVASAASRHGLRVTVGAVRPSWRGVTLSNVRVNLDGVDGVEARVDSLRVDVGWMFRPERIEASGGAITLLGTEAKLREDVDRWRGGHAGHSAGSGRAPVRWMASGVAVRWNDGRSAAPRMEASGIDASSDGGDLRLDVSEAKAHSGRWSFTLSGGHVALDAAAKTHRARLEALAIEWLAPEERAPTATSALRDERPARAVAPRDPSVARSVGSASAPAQRNPANEAGETESTELSELPALSTLRRSATGLATLLSENIAEGADVGIDALSWKLARSDEESDEGRQETALSIGPGPLRASRSASGVQIRFSADRPSETTPLSISALLPTDGSDPALSLDGGPVSFAMLGIREGATGLVDVSRASLEGHVRVVLAADGSALTFDGRLGTRGVSIRNARLAADVVSGLELDARARGVLTSGGELRLDDVGVGVGSIRVEAAGHLEQNSDRVAGGFRFALPTARCQSLLDSLPAGLLPDLQDTKIEGTFEAQGHIAFDSRALDSLELDYDVADRCRMVDVPPWLARAQFDHPFTHRIYLPDGSIAEQTTGPGTSNWTPIDDISPYMQVAVLTTEDGAFARHHGFNRASIRASIIANLKARRFVRGASTITMQLAKNLFLSRDKTLSRKIEEVILTEYLEQTFSKDELMELYLNVIEFGPAIYGITAAATYYFGRTPAELNLAECLFLSSILPAPRRYAVMREGGAVPAGWLRSLHALMEVAHRSGRITDAELAEAEGESVVFWTGGDRPAQRPPVPARPRLDGADTDDVTTDPASDNVPDAP